MKRYLKNYLHEERASTPPKMEPMFCSDSIEPQPIEQQTEVLTLVYLWILHARYTLEDN